MGLKVICAIVLVVLFNFRNLIGAPTKYPQIPTVEALEFMKRFGYLAENDDDNAGALYTEQGLSQIVKNVQRFGAIPQTGVIDNATLKLMSSRRCGVPDIIHQDRRKRFIIGPSGWNKRKLTFFVANWSPKLNEYAVTTNIQKALDTWGKYGRLNFSRSRSQDADIIVSFGRGYHGDKFPFDGSGGILAHAFFPNEGLGGDIHFDEDENWKDRRNSDDEEGTEFFAVALHELGHSLGLAHSDDENSVMFPYYGNYDENSGPQLNYDDILGMYELYIRRRFDGDSSAEDAREAEFFPKSSTTSRNPYTRKTPSSTSRRTTRWTTTTTRPTERRARHTTTTERTTQRRIYTPYPTTTPTAPDFEPTTKRRIQPTISRPNRYPTFATQSWWEGRNRTPTYEGDTETVDDHMKHDRKHDLPKNHNPTLPNICNGNFDTVATLRDELFIFKDQYVWRVRERPNIEPGYPINIYSMFPDLPKDIKNIDAAYQRLDGMIVLFTGNKYWVYDGKNFIENSPLPLSYYGLPDTLDRIDAVQVWGRNHKTYFYKYDRFWRYDETSKSMDSGYPRHMNIWKGIPSSIDAVTTWKDGYTYFFKGDFCWKFDNDFVQITDQSPWPATQWWLGCEEDAVNMASFLDNV